MIRKKATEKNKVNEKVIKIILFTTLFFKYISKREMPYEMTMIIKGKSAESLSLWGLPTNKEGVTEIRRPSNTNISTFVERLV